MNSFFHSGKVSASDVAAELVESDALLQSDLVGKFGIVHGLQQPLVGGRLRDGRQSLLFVLGNLVKLHFAEVDEKTRATLAKSRLLLRADEFSLP